MSHIKYPETYQHWGGHLPFPPADCECAKHIFNDGGVSWIDISFCAMNKCGRAPCPRRKDYSTMEEWKREYRRLSALTPRGRK